MGHAPDVPCIGCGKLTWSGTGSLPGNLRMCRGCRATLPKKARDRSWRPGPGHPRCSTVDCDRAVHARSLCKKHYRIELKRTGEWSPSPSDSWNDARRSAYHRRRARMHGQPNGDKIMRAGLRERDGDDCALCGLPIDWDAAWPLSSSPSIDHTVPISRGGAHSMDNTTMTHLGCNISKGNRLP
jgi:hypothetical protein